MNELRQVLKFTAQTRQHLTIPEMNDITGRYISAPYMAPTGLTPYTVKKVVEEFFDLDPVDALFVSRLYGP